MEPPPKIPVNSPPPNTEKTPTTLIHETTISITPESEKSIDPGPPPNGGLKAWLQVAGAFFLIFNCWGTVYVFGAFQNYYQTNPYWTATPSAISWVGSIQAFFLLFGGGISGPAYDAGYFRHLIISGCCLIPFGYMMTSLSKTYWQVMLAQGFCIGLGNGCLFLPSVAIIPQYFSTRKAFANGVSVSGSAVAGILYPIMFNHIITPLGFGWATRILGFMSLATGVFSVSVMRQRVRPTGQKRKLFLLSAFKEPTYGLLNLACIFGFFGLFTPITYLTSFVKSRQLTTVELTAYILPILNVACIPGRLLPSYIADRIGPLNVIIPCSFASCVLAFCWMAVSSSTGSIVFAIFYGFFSSGYMALLPVSLVTVTKDMATLGTRMGQGFVVGSFGLLIGTPLAGAILGAPHAANGPNWLGVQLYAGTMVMICCALMICTRLTITGWNLMKRA